ncbi:MAG: hypothetical protein GC204_18830 [Chloroflexi bacterium]|nr:hypothetical protein [Chloroflexota bacterium]
MAFDSEPGKGEQVRPHSILSTWSLRLLLAALLFFCSEILLWTNPPSRNLFDWLLLLVGYIALSALLLEIAARYRLRDVYGLLMLAGVYGMMNGLILNPQSALIDVPRTLLTRALGAHAFAGLIGLALFFGLANGSLRARRTLIAVLIVTAIIGIGWGTWAHWSPVAFANLSESTPLTLALAAGIGVVLIVVALLGVRRYAQPAPNLRLAARGWAFTLLTLVILLVIHLLQGEVDLLSLVVIVTLSAFSIMIIWFQERKKGATLLDPLASQSSAWGSLAILIIGFGLAGAVGYGLPRGEIDTDPLALISALFTAYGLIWLPAVSIVLGARAFSRQARAMRL